MFLDVRASCEPDPYNAKIESAFLEDLKLKNEIQSKYPSESNSVE